MPEQVVGAKTSDILHQQKTAEGSLTITHNTKDIIANTIGHVLAVPTTHTILWTWSSAFKHPSQELAGQLFERYKDVPWKGDVLVRVGHSSIFGDIKRMLANNEDVRGRPWLLKDRVGKKLEKVGQGAVAFSWLFDEASVVGMAIQAKLFRQDFYNPFANTVTVYHPKLAAGMHELGHAEYFNQMDPKKRTKIAIGMATQAFITIPFFIPTLEWKASAIAMKRFKSDKERREGLKLMEAAWATQYLTDVALFVPMPAAFRETLRGLMAYPASIAGHLMNRLYPKKEQRFGYIFSGKTATTDQTLKDRQILVGMANPFPRK